jgi:DNA-binding beta-propeller fold protein YncE
MGRALRLLFTVAVMAWPVFHSHPALAEARLPYVKRFSMPSPADIFRWPLSVHADLHTGEIFVCDQLNGRIVIFDSEGRYRFQITGGQVFRSPLDVAVTPEGYILVLGYVEARRQLVLLDFDGKPMADLPLTGLPEGVVETEFVSVALSPAGDRMYVLDQANFKLWIAGLDGRVSGSVDFIAGMTEEETREQFLGHVDVYGSTVLVALPMAGEVRLYSLTGEPLGRVGTKGTSPCNTAFPVSAAMDRDGNVLVLDQQRMLTMLWNPDGNQCLYETGGVGGRPGDLYKPADLALDAAGRVYISQGFDGRIQVFGNAAPAFGPGPSAKFSEALARDALE